MKTIHFPSLFSLQRRNFFSFSFSFSPSLSNKISSNLSIRFFSSFSFQSLEDFSVVRGNTLWTFLHNLPQIKHKYSSSSFPHSSNENFLLLLSNITSKIEIIDKSEMSSIDRILSSLNGLRVLNSSDIEVRLFIQKLIPILQNQRGRINQIESYRGEFYCLFVNLFIFIYFFRCGLWSCWNE